MSQQLTSAVDDRHAILSIAVKPRDTIRFVLMTKKLPYFFVVGIFGMFASNLVSFVGEKFTGQYSLGDIVYSAFMSSVVFYFLSTFLSATFLTIFARILGGKGHFKAMFRMISMTMVPYIWILPMTLFWMQFAPQSFFEIAYIDMSLSDFILQIVCGVCILIAGIWTFVLTIIGISEVHQISKWKAFFASIIVLIILGVLATFMLF